MDGGALTVEIETYGINRQVAETQISCALHPDPDHRRCVGGDSRSCEAVGKRYGCSRNSQRPQRHWITRTEGTEMPVLGLAMDRRPRRYCGGRSSGALRRIELKLRDGHRGHRPEIVGIEYAQKRFGDFRKFIVQFVMNPSGQEREGFNQPFHMRIGAFLVVIQHQTAGNTGIFLRELPGHLPDKLQLALIIRQQLISHEFAPETAILRESRCKVTSNRTSSGTRSARSSAAIWNFNTGLRRSEERR